MVVDYLGNEFKSVTEMCKHHGVNVTTYRRRLSEGKSNKEALTLTTNQQIRRSGIVDYDGHHFNSVIEMCDYHGVAPSTYYYRIGRGYSQKEALSSEPISPETSGDHKIANSKVCKDHLGNEYSSVSAMCRHYGLSYRTFTDRIRHGWSLADALNPAKYARGIPHSSLIFDSSGNVQDHLGNKFNTVSEMCREYGISPTRYYYRIKHGWNIEDTLTVKSHGRPTHRLLKTGIKRKGKEILCNGKYYNTVVELCRDNNIKRGSYLYRISLGFTPDQAVLPSAEFRKLRKKLGHRKPAYTIKTKDHLGNEFNSITEMCRFYKVSTGSYYAGLKKGIPLSNILDASLKQVRGAKPIECNGRTFKSRLELCNYYGISKVTFQSRIVKGYSVEEAVLSPEELKKVKKERNKHE